MARFKQGFRESPPFQPGEIVRYLPENHIERVERVLCKDLDGRVEWHVLTGWHRDRRRWALSSSFERIP
jgi:hypothetical protein